MPTSKRKPDLAGWLPPRVAEILGQEIARGHCGRPTFGLSAMRALDRALRSVESDLVPRLAPCERLPDGRWRLHVIRNVRFADAHLPVDQVCVKVDYDPKTGEWVSDIASGQPGFAGLAGHVWRVQGGGELMPERGLLAFVGLAYLLGLQEGAV